MRSDFASVRYELLRPAQVKAIHEKAPVAYVPVGSLEWHGRQNPLGTDSLIAHGMCCAAAVKYGGVVLPPFYQGIMGDDGNWDANWGPSGWEGYTLGFNHPTTMELAMTGVGRALLSAGWRAIVSVSGHWCKSQVDAIRRGFDAAVAGRKDVAAIVQMEGEEHKPDAEIPFTVDHAAAWETSCMMYLTGDCVDMHALDDSPMKELEQWNLGPEGIAGPNPLRHASAEMGEKIVRRVADQIGQKAMELLRQVSPRG